MLQESVVGEPHRDVRATVVTGLPASRLDLVRWIELTSQGDSRGRLTVAEAGTDVPFEIKRVFYVHDVTEDRGGHAHRDTEQLLVAVYGSLTIRAFDGRSTRNFPLADPTRGLYVPQMIYCDLIDFSPGAVCLALASTHYDITASVRNRAEFVSEIAKIEEGAT